MNGDDPTCMSGLRPRSFQWSVGDRVAVVRLSRPDRKSPLTFESYAELRDTFRHLAYATDIDVVVFASNGGNFCSGGDVHEIIRPLIEKDMKGLLAFTRMTGDLVKAILGCGKPVIAAVDGVCVGAGAIIAMASDLRLATPEARTAFLFTRVGLAACAMLPRIIGQGRAAELLYTGRVMSAGEGLARGSYNFLHPADRLEEEAMSLARRLARALHTGSRRPGSVRNGTCPSSRQSRRRRRPSACRRVTSNARTVPSPPGRSRNSRATSGMRRRCREHPG